MPTASLKIPVKTTLLLALLAFIVLQLPGEVRGAEALPQIKKIVEFDKKGTPASKALKIAYLTEGVGNPYGQARLSGLEAAAKKFGFTFQVFDANFNPSEQLKQAQLAASGGFDGFLLAPTAGAQACSFWNRLLKPLEKPVVTIDLPMCGDRDYTQGLAGTVVMATQDYYDQLMSRAFASCEAKCSAAIIGGVAGSDLYESWQKAVKSASAKYPNVEVVSNQPGNFDPKAAYQIVQNALIAHPDLKIVVSQWDDMTRGVEQAALSSKKRPGTDLLIFSAGGTKDAIEKVRSGAYASTTILLPWEESYYGAVALLMALAKEPLNQFVDEALLPSITEGPGTIVITKANAETFQPRY